MRLLIQTFCLLLISCPAVFSQADDAKLQSLQKQTSLLSREGNLDELIAVGEKIVDLEKRNANRAAYTTALRNLASWKTQRLERIRTSAKLTPAVMTKYNWEVRETTKIFEDLLSLAERGADSREIAMAP